MGNYCMEIQKYESEHISKLLTYCIALRNINLHDWQSEHRERAWCMEPKISEFLDLPELRKRLHFKQVRASPTVLMFYVNFKSRIYSFVQAYHT